MNYDGVLNILMIEEVEERGSNQAHLSFRNLNTFLKKGQNIFLVSKLDNVCRGKLEAKNWGDMNDEEQKSIIIMDDNPKISIHWKK